jgi:hypothetical protein
MQKNHDLTKSEATKIVIKNLKKNQFYYTDSLISGVEGYEPGYIGGKSANAEARQMQPLEKNMSNVVDKKMGMQPVKGIEKPKKDSDKGGETNKIKKGVSLMSLVAKTVRGLKKMDATGEKMKKISIKEAIEILTNEESFRNLMKDYDWYYNMSDDPRVYNSGSATDKKLKQIGNKIGAEKAAKIWNEYAPEENLKVKASFFKLNEVKLNNFSSEEPNEAVQLAMQFINSNPTLKQYSDNITLQNSYDRAILKFNYWEVLPDEAFNKLELQFEVEDDVEEHDDKAPTVAYILTPKHKRPTQSGVARFLTKEDLMEMIREELEEALGAYNSGDNVTDVAGGDLEENATTDIENKIKSGEIKPEEVKAAAEKAVKGDSADLAILMAFGK